MDAPDVASHVLHGTLTLAARASQNTTSSDSSSSGGRPPIYKVIGIVLAVCSGLFIGVSFVLKKLGLLKANVKYNEEAGEGYGYLKNAYWWTGMTLMIIGEICNFVAYAFTDAILVTPLGALSVVITTVLSAIFLKERLSFVGKISCLICILGSVVIVLNAPAQAAVADIQEMQHYVISPGFLSYTGVIIAGCLVVIFFVAPKYGKKSMLVYLSVCSLIGGLSVVATQGLGSAVLAQINGKPQFNQWFTYVLLVFVIATLLTEIIYLNKALNLFNAALVTPTYYVYFTSSTIVASAVLFQGFHGTAIQIIDVVVGFLIICSGVVLLQLAKSSKDVPDTAVLKGDLDQVRTVAEQEEPEYEPRADTIRGGAGIVRALSRVRTQRQANEAKRIHEERMAPIGEHEEYEWDGLRRRKTVSTAHSGSVKRTKTQHPPLGMTQFPDDISEPDSEVHPGFFGRIGRKSLRNSGRGSVPLGSLNAGPTTTASYGEDGTTDVKAYDPSLGMQKAHPGEDFEDTSYKSPGPSGSGSGARIHFASDVADSHHLPSSPGGSLAPPAPPPHSSSGGTKRQFSFTNVFQRKRSDSHDDAGRPISRGALSFASQHSGRAYPSSAGAGATEEERLGLVQGDSSKSLPKYSELVNEPDELDHESDEWQVTSGASSSPEQLHLSASADLSSRRSRGDPYNDDDDDDDDAVLYDEPLHSPSPGAHDNGRSGSRPGTRSGAFI